MCPGFVQPAPSLAWYDRAMRRLRTSRGLWIGVGLAVLIAAAVAIRLWLFTDLPDVNDLSKGLHRPSIRITDRQGRLLYEVIGDNPGRNTVVPLADIPLACRDATIATEDASFYHNPGVDPASILRAVWINLQGGEVLSGGSTITQQVARNLLLDPKERDDRTLTRKLRESILAYRLSQAYGKDEILALYLNQTYYGNLAYGIDAAARAYFGKPVDQLDLAECALLAGLPQSPSTDDPLTDPAAAKTRQGVVLDLMVTHGYISREEANTAGKEPLAFAAERYTIEAPHFVMAVYDQLESNLPPDVLYQGGLEVRTTLDLDWQHAAEQIVARQLGLLNAPKPTDPPHNAGDAALVALDPHTGQVLAMVGSANYFDPEIGGAINLALAPRQPGSALKPFTYSLAFDPNQSDPWNAATMILDVRTSFVTRDGQSYVPVNYDRQEHGPVLARTALASSFNVPAVITLQHVGLDRLFNLLGRLGVTTLRDPKSYDLSLTLGGGEVRLLELTAAYGAFANQGKSVHPLMILDVKNEAGQTIWQPDPPHSDQVIDPRVAWLISDILSDNLARAPTFTTHSILQIGRPAAVKTGTTTDFRDNWTVGYTPNLVVGVWVGNADNSGMVDISGVSGAGPIWHNFMREVLNGQPELPFTRPDGLVQGQVCALSGLLPTPDCPATIHEWFIAGTQPTRPDTFYQTVTLDSATGLPADSSTPPERRVTKVLLNLPPQARPWAQSVGLALVPDGVDTGQVALGEPSLRLISPDPQSIYQISPSLPLDAQKLKIAAVAPASVHDVTIYLDDVPLAHLSAPPFETWWQIAVGQHQVYASGIDAGGAQVKSEVVPFTVQLPN